MSETEHPPDAEALTDQFFRAVKRCETFEEVQWVTALYEALNSHEWGNAQYRAWVLTQQETDFNSLLWAVDEEYVDWLDDEV